MSHKQITKDLLLPGWPRGMPEPLAAAYVGLSVSTLRAERAAGRFPAQTQLTIGRYVYLKESLDDYLDKKAGIIPEVNPWDLMCAMPLEATKRRGGRPAKIK